MMSRLLSCVAALLLLVVATPAAAQDTISDRDLLNRPHSGGLSPADRNRYDEIQKEASKHLDAGQAQSQSVQRLPPLPVERNVLLGSWRVEGSGQRAGGTEAMFRELWAALESNPDKMLCVPRFGNGITFEPSSYAISALDGSVVRGSIAYRSGQERVIVAAPNNGGTMVFEIADSNRIVSGGCVLVRVGAPKVNAAVNAPTAAVAGLATPAPAPSPSPPTARAQESASLAVGPDAGGYYCPDGRQILVSHCYDQSAQASCQVVHLHKKNNGLNPETAATRAELLVGLSDCSLTPLEFGPGGSISLVK